MYDEPFAGLDPISLGTAARLIRQLNDALGLTSIIVSHDLDETFHIADQVIVLANGKIAARAHQTKCVAAVIHWCISLSVQHPKGRCAFTTQAPLWWMTLA